MQCGHCDCGIYAKFDGENCLDCSGAMECPAGEYRDPKGCGCLALPTNLVHLQPNTEHELNMGQSYAFLYNGMTSLRMMSVNADGHFENVRDFDTIFDTTESIHDEGDYYHV